MNIFRLLCLFLVIGSVGFLLGCELQSESDRYSPLSGRPLKTDGQQLLYGLVAYSWDGMSSSKRQELINMLVYEGWTGVNLELMSRLAWWPNGEQTDDYVRTMKGKIDRIGGWVKDCERAGLWLYVVDINSNADVNRNIGSLEDLKEISDYFTDKYSGYRNVIRLPVSENDSDLDSGYRQGYISHVEATWPDEQTSAMSNFRGSAKWSESHMSSVYAGAPGGGWRKFAVTDSASILVELCGSVTGKRMDVEKAAYWVDSMLGGGNSVSLYALGTGVDEGLIRRIGEIAREKDI